MLRWPLHALHVANYIDSVFYLISFSLFVIKNDINNIAKKKHLQFSSYSIFYSVLHPYILDNKCFRLVCAL